MAWCQLVTNRNLFSVDESAMERREAWMAANKTEAEVTQTTHHQDQHLNLHDFDFGYHCQADRRPILIEGESWTTLEMVTKWSDFKTTDVGDRVKEFTVTKLGHKFLLVWQKS